VGGFTIEVSADRLFPAPRKRWQGPLPFHSDPGKTGSFFIIGARIEKGRGEKRDAYRPMPVAGVGLRGGKRGILLFPNSVGRVKRKRGG